MHTTYYYIADKLLKINKNLNVISIALFSPSWYKGREYTKLAPTKQILKDYKDGTIDEQTYIYRYYEEILDKLDAEQIYDELGKDAILVCWEGSDKFCHRHLVADWFYEKLNIEVKEISKIVVNFE